MSPKYLARSLPAVVLGAGLLFGLGAPGVSARSHRVCDVRIDRVQARLSSDVYRHGELSRQATRDRANLVRVQEQCSLAVE